MDEKTIRNVMEKALEQARTTMNDNIGGPFGAAVIGPKGELLSVSSNSVLRDHDPTAHAEVNAIRKAAKVLGTHDLSNCIVVTTAYPCPMCLGAIIWANIKHVIYGCRPKDAAAIGFRDDFIYTFIEGGQKDHAVLKIEESLRDTCLPIFEEYQKKSKEIY